MFYTPEKYAKQFKESLDKYEQLIKDQNHLTDEYINKRKEAYKWAEEKFNDQIERLQKMNVTDFYISSLNMNMANMYWETYVLWLEKVKNVYELDMEYFKNLMNLTSPVLKINPFLSPYTIFDVYNHFNFLKPLAK